MRQNKIAFTDFEFTGLSPVRHEIIEFGLIVADAQTLAELDRLDEKVRPENIVAADPAALAIAGYKEPEWNNARSLREVLEQYAALTRDCIFAAWTAPYDWPFLLAAFEKTGIANPMDYHTLDIFTLAHEKFSDTADLKAIKLSAVCEYLGISKEPMPHRAINGAECVWQLYKKLKEL